MRKVVFHKVLQWLILFLLFLDFKPAQHATVEMALACVLGALDSKAADHVPEAQKSSLFDLV